MDRWRMVDLESYSGIHCGPGMRMKCPEAETEGQTEQSEAAVTTSCWLKSFVACWKVDFDTFRQS